MKARVWGVSACVALACAAAPGIGQAQEFRIGFISTMSGGGAVIGRHQVNGWHLGLEHEGWTKNGDKLGGVPTSIFEGDDQQKPDVGIELAHRLIQQDKVQLIVGVIWSNILLPIQKVTVENKVGLIGTNAGTSLIAGARCNPLFLSSSWQGDQPSEAVGKMIAQDKVKTIVLLAPNYQGGKDLISGAKRGMGGKVKILDTLLFKLGTSDFQAEISKVRAIKPQAIFVFAPGAMGISFVKQWHASGANKEIKLYSAHTIDWVTLPAIGEAGVGANEAIQWLPDFKNAVSEKFVKDYKAKYGATPSNFAEQTYEAARLIAAALRAEHGKVGDMTVLMKKMRRVSFPSARGPFKFNVNGFPIQNFYKSSVINGADGKPTIVNGGLIVANARDSYWQKCPVNMRY
jgi:branched-chain amino acid transport system substrate-binding protein